MPVTDGRSLLLQTDIIYPHCRAGYKARRHDNVLCPAKPARSVDDNPSALPLTYSSTRQKKAQFGQVAVSPYLCRLLRPVVPELSQGSNDVKEALASIWSHLPRFDHIGYFRIRDAINVYTGSMHFWNVHAIERLSTISTGIIIII